MEPSRLRCMLIVRDGPSRRVGPGGLLIGRQRDCDVVVDDLRISRRHALVRLTPDGAEVVPLGRTPIELNGKPRERPCALADGDTLALPGLELVVRVHAARVDASAPATYRLERARGGSFGLVHSPFVIGGGEADDLIVQRWPAGALRFALAQRELFVEVTSGSATKNGSALDAGVLELLAIGDAIAYRKETFVVRAAVTHDATTAVATLGDLPTRVAVEMLPRGGRVVFTVGDGEHAVYLADRGLDLIAALLRPPAGFAAGEFVPDDVIRPIVWPRSTTVSRPEINMLISRCRRVLVEAGLSGPRLLVRAPGGGATKLALAPGAQVSVG